LRARDSCLTRRYFCLNMKAIDGHEVMKDNPSRPFLSAAITME
jgi:hypothetical protein